jgi:hypothetical protein
MDLEWGGGRKIHFQFQRIFQLLLVRTCGGALKACIMYKHIVDRCEYFIGSAVLGGTCIDDCRHPRSHVKLARMFFEAAR